MRYSNIITILLSIFISFSCTYKDEQLSYKGKIFIFNDSSYDIHIMVFKDKKTSNDFYLAPKQNALLYKTIPENNIFTSINDIKIEDFLASTNIEKNNKRCVKIYSVKDNILLKSWYYKYKDNDGKQLYRLSDYEYVAKNDSGIIFINYEFHITDEDLQNQ